MFFLSIICENVDFLNFVYFGTKIFKLVFLLIPIALIVLLIIDIFKMVTGGASDEKLIKTNIKEIINRIVFAVLIFFVPTIVDVTMSVIANVGIDIGENYKICIENAESSRADNTD